MSFHILLIGEKYFLLTVLHSFCRPSSNFFPFIIFPQDWGKHRSTVTFLLLPENSQEYLQSPLHGLFRVSLIRPELRRKHLDNSLCWNSLPCLLLLSKIFPSCFIAWSWVISCRSHNCTYLKRQIYLFIYVSWDHSVWRKEVCSSSLRQFNKT